MHPPVTPTWPRCPDCGAPGGYSGLGPLGHRYECPTPHCPTVCYYTAAAPVRFTPTELRRLDFARWLVQTGRLSEQTA